jgi:hypothetical protein
MWKRKTFEEIMLCQLEHEQKNRKYNLPLSIKRFVRAFLIIFPLLCIMALIVDPLPSTWVSHPYKPIPLSELPEYFDIYLLIAFTFATYRFLMSYFYPDFFSKRYSSILICNRCFITKSGGKQNICSCGGQFENIDYYKWVEEKINGIPTEEMWVEDYKVMKNKA